MPRFPLEPSAPRLSRGSTVSRSISIPAAARRSFAARSGRPVGRREVWVDCARSAIARLTRSFLPGQSRAAAGDPRVDGRRSWAGARLLADLYAGVGTHGLALRDKVPARALRRGDAQRGRGPEVDGSTIPGWPTWRSAGTAVERSLATSAGAATRRRRARIRRAPAPPHRCSRRSWPHRPSASPTCPASRRRCAATSTAWFAQGSAMRLGPADRHDAADGPGRGHRVARSPRRPEDTLASRRSVRPRVPPGPVRVLGVGAGV